MYKREVPLTNDEYLRFTHAISEARRLDWMDKRWFYDLLDGKIPGQPASERSRKAALNILKTMELSDKARAFIRESIDF